jgi:U5 snRNP spliceosome subunit
MRIPGFLKGTLPVNFCATRVLRLRIPGARRPEGHPPGPPPPPAKLAASELPGYGGPRVAAAAPGWRRDGGLRVQHGVRAIGGARAALPG